MAERKFTRVLSKPGSAAQARETVSQAVRESSVLFKPLHLEPLDYETFILKNRTQLQNDPQKDLIQFPQDDVHEVQTPKEIRTTTPQIPEPDDSLGLFSRECLRTYSTGWNTIVYKHHQYAGTYIQLPRLPKSSNLQDQVYEVDAENDCESLSVTDSLCNSVNGVTKEGYMFRGPESMADSFISLATKSYKRRFLSLRKTVDGTYILEFYKDERKMESKGTICMDFCTGLIRNNKRGGKLSFELRMADGYKPCILAAESETELEGWISCIQAVLVRPPPVTPDRRSIVSTDSGIAEPPSPSINYFGTLKSLEHSKNPELVKYAKETDHTIAQARKENRQNIFAIYPDIDNNPPMMINEDMLRAPNVLANDVRGVHIFVRCDEIQFRLQVALENNGGSMCQVEPYITSLAIFDASLGRKVTEEFRFDVNTPYIRNMLPSRRGGPPEACPSTPVGSSLVEEWLAYPRQAVFTVPEATKDLYLVARIEKVLQGSSLSQVAEPYIRGMDGRAALKVHKTVRACCQRIGHYRMPFAWAAKPLFKQFTRDLEELQDLGPIYRQDSSKLSDEDLMKHLMDFKKPDKLKNLPVIPGQIKIQVHYLEEALPNMLTSCLAPKKPFPIPPTHPPTLEIQQFPAEKPEGCYPFSAYLNLLYIFPRNLRYDNQKHFNKARNIACFVELRDSDEENSIPLKCIFGRPGEGLFIKQACTAVLHHSTCPDFYEEVKVLLPIHVTEKHHLRFTFYHVGCEQPKKRDGAVESVIGYAWFPLLEKGRLNVNEPHSLPVAAHLPPGYLSCQPLGLGKGMGGPDIKWVDGGKELFKFELRLMSSIYTQDIHLHNFFSHCERLFDPKQTCSDTDTNIVLKALHAVSTTSLVYFLPTILNQLFKLLVHAGGRCEEIALNAVRILIHIVHTMYTVGKGPALMSYVQYVLDTEHVAQGSGTTVHAELSKSLTTTLRPANTDFLVINKFLRHAGFFTAILVKSMAQHLLSSNRIALPRHERFPSDFQYRVQSLVQGMIPHIFQKYREQPMDIRSCNTALALFIKRCFTFMDRGFVFKIINLYLEKFNPGDPLALQEYKFEFLQAICSHEHFIALNLPFLCGASSHHPRKHTKNITDYEHEYRLSEEFCHHHFLVGALLQEVKQALSEVQDVRTLAICVLRNLLVKHAFDDRFHTKPHQARIASLYLPFISIVLENLHRLVVGVTVEPPEPPQVGGSTSTLVASTPGHTLSSSGRSNRDSTYLAIIAGQVELTNQNLGFPAGSSGSLDSGSSTPSLVSEKTPSMSVSASMGHSRSQSLPFASGIAVRYDKLDPYEIKDLLVCFLYVVKHINEELLIGWWQHCLESDALDFFRVFELCLHQFRYMGKRKHSKVVQGRKQAKAMTLPARIAPPSFSNMTEADIHSSTLGGPKASSNQVEEEEGDGGPSQGYRGLLEANLATEVGLITLDVLGLYTLHFGDTLTRCHGDNLLMARIFDIYLSFLQVGQSETLLRHLFAALRSFITKFPIALFEGDAELCGKLCFELLRCCNSRLSTVRSEACALVYLLMRSNFDFSGRQSLTRVHLQLMVAVSRLLGDVVSLNTTRFQESLSVVNTFASSDKAMQHTVFPTEVKNLTKKVRTVLMATLQMREHERDPEMLVDLQHKLANSYSATPALRKTWLESMARFHAKNGNHSEAAHCHIHVGALIAEYLRHKGLYPRGCGAFSSISPNVEQDEGSLRAEDLNLHDTQYSEDTLLSQLELCGFTLEKAERYELMAEIYKLIIPIYEKRRNFQALADCYKVLHSAYTRVIEVTKSGKRLLGRYYRVAFFGQPYFEEESGKEYIYKEPKVTSLVEISDRLYRMFCDKFGKDQVKMIMDSNQVNVSDLDPKLAYIQVTHVTPYFEETELALRTTEFERNNNLRFFMFETPFTRDGNRVRGTPQEQCKRRTILATLNSFPYVKTRIPVSSKTVTVLEPIEVALGEMQARVAELQEVIALNPPDIKKLQLKLQGSISVTVNAGPLAYCSAFLEDSQVGHYPPPQVEELREVFRRFLEVSGEALELNGQLVGAEQHQYHAALRTNFHELAQHLASYLHRGEPERRNSQSTISFLSGSSLSSSTV